jgi:LAO/AO transport system kinase
VKRPIDLEELAGRVVARDPAAVGRAISIIEDRRKSSEAYGLALLGALRSLVALERAQRVGVTGPPGVGKSSLVSLLARTLRARGKSVGVLAVDPSSPRTGGALLGDRARIEIDPDDVGLFVRSMASGGDLGGLSRAAGAAADVLSAAYDVVIVETTGVGQSETDVEHVTDTVVLVIQPGSGDVLQFLKAGILEIPDVFVVNKADLGDIAQRAGADLRAALAAIHAGAATNAPPLVFTSVPTGQGIGELVDVISAHRKTLEQDGTFSERRVRAAAAWALRLYLQRHGEVGVERAGGADALRLAFARDIGRGLTAVEAVAAQGRAEDT